LKLSNTGAATFHVIVYDVQNPSNVPRHYTVEAGKTLSDSWGVSGPYGLELHGPNGYLRRFFGDLSSVKPTTANPEIVVRYDAASASVVKVTFNNTGAVACRFVVTANAYRKDGPWTFTVEANAIVENKWDVGSSGNWYDFSVVVDDFGGFERKLMGRVENGQDLITDPAMAG